jgi:integrase
MIRTLSIREFFRSQYEVLKLAAATPGTIENYITALNHLRDFRGGRDPLLQELDEEMVAAAMGKLLKDGRSPATANSFRRHIMAIWRYAKKRGFVADIPEVLPFKQPKRLPRAKLIAEIGRILQAAAREPGTIGEIPARWWWTALVLVIYDTGLRISAVMAMRWENYDAVAGTVLAPWYTQKQDADQLLPLSPQSVEALEHVRGGDPLLFPWPYDHWGRQWPTLNRHFRLILQRAGLPSTRKDLFHALRRSTASYIKAGGGDATWQLGHSSQQTTKVYLDPRIVKPPRQVDLLPRPDAGKDFRQRYLF